jgi:hypothetical protein
MPLIRRWPRQCGEIEEDEKSEDDAYLLFDWSAIVRRYKKTNGKKKV